MSARRAAKRWLEQAPPEVQGCWDNKGKTVDRYIVAVNPGPDYKDTRLVPLLSMSEAPSHPQGVSMWGDGLKGRHLGTKVRWLDLPEHIRKHVAARLKEGS